MTVFDEPKSSIFQTLVFFACLLLISAVDTLSKRIDRSSKAEDEIQALRKTIDDAFKEIRELQAKLSRQPEVPSAPRGPWES